MSMYFLASTAIGSGPSVMRNEYGATVRSGR